VQSRLAEGSTFTVVLPIDSKPRPFPDDRKLIFPSSPPHLRPLK
jgi:hypothetical protein